ncbi:MAG: DNA repair exonuclease [Gemmatimonadaceae bacterium]
MRVVHLADLHLGFRQYYRVTPAGINQREADVAGAFRRAVDQVIALRPDVVLIAGDVFHTVRPMNPAIIHAFTQFARLSRALPDAVIVMVAGNHDQPRSTETGCILRLFAPLGIHVVVDEPRRLSFAERELSILAVPDLPARPALAPEDGVRHNVLLLHGEVEGMLGAGLQRADRANLEISKQELAAARWSYVALGHYHVHREIAPNAFYAGSLDYTSTNPWGELAEERDLGLPGKGFVEFDLQTRERRFHHVEPGRRLLDLPELSARGMTTSDLDAAIRDGVESAEGGIDEKIVRLLVRDAPRHITRDLDHKALREYKRRALHFHLDARRPEITRTSMGGAAGRRPSLPDIVRGYLSGRLLDADIDREALIQLGVRYLQEADAAEAAATTGGSPAGAN